MDWSTYWGVVRRRWYILLAIVILDVIAGGAVYARSRHAAGYQACTTLYVADVSAPSLIAAPQTTLETAGQLLAGETAANFFGDDVLDVAESSSVSSFVSSHLAGEGLPKSARADINGSVSGSRHDRTVALCVTNPNSRTALAAASEVGTAMTSSRSQFLGAGMAKRTYVAVISGPTVGAVPASTSRLRLGLQFILGLLLAGGIALLWDAADPTVRDRADLERLLNVPVAGMST
jgi:capsular polysaccharide biosynthesis protein